MTSGLAKTRRIVPYIGMAATAILLVAAFVLGLVSFGKMRQVITEEFNQQQLVLAKNLSALIRQDLDFLSRELMVLNSSPSIQFSESPSWRSRMKVTMNSIQGEELLEIWRWESLDKDSSVMDRTGGVRTERWPFDEARLAKWARDGANRNKIMMALMPQTAAGKYGGRPLLLMAVPTYQVSPDEAHATPPGRFAGALAFMLDASAVASRFVDQARSGTTGYAWVIDGEGIFLAHPKHEFIGRNAFMARHQEFPSLGFERINEIMRDEMLTGQEGTGEYVSGWHRDVAGPVEKLIAYAPVEVHSRPPRLFWSVAVVAPTSEVHGLVRSLFMRQFFTQAAIFLAILAGAFSVLRLERYWGNLQKQKEREINLSSRLAALGTLSAGVAHEINNPIAIILGFTDLLLEKIPEGAEGHEQLKIIERQGLACKKIVENLSRFARIPEQRDETSDMNEEVKRVVAMVQNTLLTEKIVCKTELHEGLPRVMGDPQGLGQVLLNLITNARAAMKNGGMLTIGTRQSGDFAELWVQDTGSGIRRQDLGHIFDPFFTTKAPGEGTGLGLSISHGIIERAGGAMTVQSRHEEEAGSEPSGTTFTVRLPVADKTREDA